MGSVFGTNAPKLANKDLNTVAEYMKSCKNVIVMSGAGISTAAGIPDFRSPEFGLYRRLEKYNLPYPTAVFTLDYFKQDPRAFYEIAHELYPTMEKARPTVAHYFIKLLNDKGILLRHYTQNIDGLDDFTGLPSDKLVQAHGHMRSGTCLGCRSSYTFEFMKESVVKNEIPKCTKCNGVVKPDVVLFGEGLPKGFWGHLFEFRKCDLLIIMGTSLVVQPFASLAGRVSNNCPRLLINRDHVGDSGFAGVASFLFDPKFDSNHSSRDVFFQGDCDDGCKQLADLLGWGQELEQLIAQGKQGSTNL